MGLKNLVRRTVFYLLVAAVVMAVLIPSAYFVTLSFSSNYEAYQFPAKLLPSFSYDARFVHNPGEDSFSLLIRRGGEYESVKTDYDSGRMLRYMKDQLNVEWSPERLEETLAEAREEGSVSLKLQKSVFRNYRVFMLLADGSMAALKNSIEAAAWTILISLSLGGLAGYVMARMRFRFSDTFSLTLLLVRMFPAVAISLPMVIYIMKMNLYDTPLSLALVYSVPNIALTAWITCSIFKGVGAELEEAAMVFGASRPRTLFSITLPLAFPALVASSIYAFLAAWNDSITALIMTDQNPTLALLVYRTVGSSSIPNLPAAGAIILLIPSLVFTFIIKNYISQIWGDASIT